MSGLRDGRPGVSAFRLPGGEGEGSWMSTTVFDSAYPGSPSPCSALTPPGVWEEGAERAWGALTAEPRAVMRGD